MHSAPVAQLDRAPGFEPVGREFESLRARLNASPVIRLVLRVYRREGAEVMAATRRFEDLDVWKKARTLAGTTYKVTANSRFNDVAPVRQMRAATVSILSNIAEGFGRARTKNSSSFFTSHEDLRQDYRASVLQHWINIT
jgi:hypothetical protein